MIKLKLKRRISGKAIRQDKRQKKFHPTLTYTVVDKEGNEHTYTSKRYVNYENKGMYRKNSVEKRHVENPNIYEGEEPLKCATRNIRVPSRKRKTAMKRFKKAFPYIEVGKDNKPFYNPKNEPYISPQAQKLLK